MLIVSYRATKAVLGTHPNIVQTRENKDGIACNVTFPGSVLVVLLISV